MAIKHVFVTEVENCADSAMLRPSNWNEDHEIEEGSITSPSIGDDAILGWQFDGEFSATDYNTVEWTSGTLTYSNGTEYSISAGNTGEMIAPTWICFYKATSTTVLQTTTISSSAVGINKICMCYAENVADTTKNAIFKAFGGKSTSVITTKDIEALAVTQAEVAADAITTAKIAADAVTEAELAASAVGSDQLAAGSVIAGKIAALAIVAADIAAATITGAKIAATTITAANIAAQTITASQILTGTITALQIAARTITADKIATDTITANEIAANTITAGEITTGTLVGLKIATAANGARVEMNGTANALTIYDAGALRQKILSDEHIFYNSSGTERLSLYANDNGGTVDVTHPSGSLSFQFHYQGFYVGIGGRIGIGTSFVNPSGAYSSATNVSGDATVTPGDLGLNTITNAVVCSAQYTTGHTVHGAKSGNNFVVTSWNGGTKEGPVAFTVMAIGT